MVSSTRSVRAASRVSVLTSTSTSRCTPALRSSARQPWCPKNRIPSNRRTSWPTTASSGGRSSPAGSTALRVGLTRPILDGPDTAPSRRSGDAGLLDRLQEGLVVVDGIDHHHLEEVLEVALEQLHELLAELGAGVAVPRLQGRDVVLSHPQATGQLPLGQLVPVPHGAEPDGAYLDVHGHNVVPDSVFVNARACGYVDREPGRARRDWATATLICDHRGRCAASARNALRSPTRRAAAARSASRRAGWRSASASPPDRAASGSGSRLGRSPLEPSGRSGWRSSRPTRPRPLLGLISGCLRG